MRPAHRLESSAARSRHGRFSSRSSCCSREPTFPGESEMKKHLIAGSAAAGITLTVALAAGLTSTYTPGTRIQVLSHNAYPDHGKYADRLDRTLASGLPVAIE